jgi:hypothetical protein
VSGPFAGPTVWRFAPPHDHIGGVLSPYYVMGESALISLTLMVLLAASRVPVICTVFEPT